MSAQAAPRSREEVAAAIERLAARPELDDEPSLLSRALSWLAERIFSSSGPEVVGVIEAVVRVLVVVLAVALAAVIVAAVVRRIRARRTLEAPDAAVRTRVAELRERARAARARGDVALALRYLLFALVVGLGQRGDLLYRDAWTNRELVERGRPSQRVRALLLPLIDELEAKEFGRVPVEPADVERLAELCDRWLGREAAA